MKQEHIELLKEKLVQVNPLGENVKSITDLDDYDTEAKDILFNIKKGDSSKRVEKMVREILEEAFCIDLQEMDISEITELIMVLQRDL